MADIMLCVVTRAAAAAAPAATAAVAAAAAEVSLTLHLNLSITESQLCTSHLPVIMERSGGRFDLLTPGE